VKEAYDDRQRSGNSLRLWLLGKRNSLYVISQLSPEQFTQDVGGSHGSIRNTMVHVLSAEWGWLSRCGGPERGPRLNPADYPTVESLMAAWSKVELYFASSCRS